MSIFGTIMGKIFGAAAPAETPAAPDAPAAEAVAPDSTPTTAFEAPPPPPAEPVDVEAVLTAMAATKPGGNWQTSIVDLLKLLDMDSSLGARTELAKELNCHVGADGTAEQNIALHKAVMEALAANGGVVPDSLKG